MDSPDISPADSPIIAEIPPTPPSPPRFVFRTSYSFVLNVSTLNFIVFDLLILLFVSKLFLYISAIIIK